MSRNLLCGLLTAESGADAGVGSLRTTYETSEKFVSMTPQEWQSAGECDNVGGHRVFFRDTGETKPCVLLLHGFPTSSWDWDPVWTALQTRFRLIAFDFPGFGFSDRPRRHRYTIGEQASVAEELLQKRDVQEYHLIAHDYGNTVAQELLARQVDSTSGSAAIQSVCFLNGGLFPECHRPRLIQTLLRTPLGPLLLKIYDKQRFGRSFSAVFGAETRPSAEQLAEFWSVVAGNGGRRMLHRLLHYIPERAVRRERWVGAMIRCPDPIRFICGRDDPVSGAHMATRYRELIPQPDVVELSGIGHYPQVEAPDAVLSALSEFYDRLVRE